jgi:hypothetical protein
MRLGLFLLASALALHTAGAQSRGDLLVRVRVVDTTSAPMDNIAVSAIAGVRDVLASGVTDRNGVRVLLVPRTSAVASLQLVARKVGYQPAMRIIAVDWRDTIVATLVLRRAVTRLDALRVTAEEDVKRRRTYVDAEAIAAFERPLLNSMDVIEKMRPNMFLEPPSITDGCQMVQNIWVNGKRVVAFLPDPRNPRTIGLRNTAQAIPLASRARIGPALKGITPGALEVLASIQPEHIASMEYHDCMSNNMEQAGGNSALFITLKEGVAFNYSAGSYVIGSAAADSIARRIMRKDASVSPLRTGDTILENWRLRILGVFDAESGSALPEVDIVDVISGVRARTTETGTVSLAFLTPGPSRVVISKPGFRNDTLQVTISPSDTLPLTVLLAHSDH